MAAPLTYKLAHEGSDYKFEFPAPYEPQFKAMLATAPGGGTGSDLH